MLLGLVTCSGFGLHTLVLELVQRDVLAVGLVDDGFGADVEFAFLFDVVLAGHRIHVRARAREVLDVRFILLQVVQGEAFRLGLRDPHIVLDKLFEQLPAPYRQ